MQEKYRIHIGDCLDRWRKQLTGYKKKLEL